MIYIDAIVDAGGDSDPAVWARPSMCTWMSDSILARDSNDDRAAWRAAAVRGKNAILVLLNEWGLDFAPRYADNSRETLRDETFKQWLEHGALRQKVGVPTASSVGRWALSSTFADLFDPSLTGVPLDSAIENWREANMSPGARLKAMQAANLAKGLHEVVVTMPGGGSRSLEPGDASFILKGVIEEWAPQRLGDAVVLTISEPGDKIYTGDAQILRKLGIKIDPTRVLPDAVIADVATDPVTFWIVEAVATDGPVNESRKAKLIAWAEDQNIEAESCSFLSAFMSRNATPARRRLKDLAVGTFAWYADDPGNELAWYELKNDAATGQG